MKEETTATTTDNLVEITINSDTHTHEGRLCQRGDKITVDKQVAVMLEREWAKQNKEK